jgi:hypothetical protein
VTGRDAVGGESYVRGLNRPSGVRFVPPDVTFIDQLRTDWDRTPSLSGDSADASHLTNYPRLPGSGALAVRRRLAQISRDLGEQPQRFGVGVIAAPGVKAGAPKIDVGPDLFRNLLGGTHEVAGSP